MQHAKMSVNNNDSWSTKCFRVDAEMESGLAALQGFYLLNSLSMSFFRIVVFGEKGALEVVD